jgi:poly(hydroxyalkanoate) granule-associated protein
MGKKEKKSEERSQLLEAARRILLAGIGAIALAQDEIEDFVNKLVERGEIAEKDGKKLVREVLEKRKEHTGKFEEEFGKRVEEVLARMNIPSKTDINALNEKITAIEKKIEAAKSSPE